MSTFQATGTLNTSYTEGVWVTILPFLKSRKIEGTPKEDSIALSLSSPRTATAIVVNTSVRLWANGLGEVKDIPLGYSSLNLFVRMAGRALRVNY